MTDQQVYDAIREINARLAARRADALASGIHVPRRYASALDVANALGLDGARRHGNGAVKGSWSGYMSPALRVAPRLRAMAQDGRLRSHWDGRRSTYLLPSDDDA